MFYAYVALHNLNKFRRRGNQRESAEINDTSTEDQRQEREGSGQRMSYVVNISCMLTVLLLDHRSWFSISKLLGIHMAL